MKLRSHTWRRWRGSTVTDWEREFVASARVGRLATADRQGEPHVIPVCFVLDGDTIWSIIDEKPKSGRRLKRLRNIEETGKAALVVDHYDEDWTQLAWVMLRGIATIQTVSEDTLALLREKYPQYVAMKLEGAEVVRLAIDRWSSWRSSPQG